MIFSASAVSVTACWRPSDQWHERGGGHQVIILIITSIISDIISDLFGIFLIDINIFLIIFSIISLLLALSLLLLALSS